jgi:uncharacterized protein YndB with AHSA1/START domain
MQNESLDFKIDKSTNSVTVNKTFKAPLSLVWDAFTTQPLLDQWWAPRPWSSKTKSMEFKPGGRRLYAMVSPEGEQHWSTQDYTSITATSNFEFTDAFTDEAGVANNNMPSSEWSLDFTEHDGVTTVAMRIVHNSAEALEQILQMGFQGGFTMTLTELDALLEQWK